MKTYTVKGRTPAGTWTSWTSVNECDLWWFKKYLGSTYEAAAE